ncbi:hypothetical protein Sango_2097300 [Sesamum angolense]|uniref:Uncharacterized protein n=1 Tax=Sesamum angolense TaxID=2727404 RepID=A0AAE1WBJ5_9LAMI|nr:hypothetical protein Sango_2097300 [Sesamum angolense]
MSKEEGDKRNGDNPWPQPNRDYQEKEEGMRLWGILVFGLIGATVTTFAVTQLRRTADWFYSGLNHHGRIDALSELVFKRKHGEDIIAACKKNTKKKWREL